MVSAPPTTIVLVDVDGVINVDDRGLWDEDGWRKATVLIDSIGWRVHWNAGVIDALHRIEALPGVEMQWCTTWEHTAAEYLSHRIGIGRWWTHHSKPASAGGGWLDTGRGEWWKADVAREALDVADRVVWVDDDIDDWLSEGRKYNPGDRFAWMDMTRLLAVCPSPWTGLQPDHLAAIERFVLTGERPGTS